MNKTAKSITMRIEVSDMKDADSVAAELVNILSSALQGNGRDATIIGGVRRIEAWPTRED